MTSVDIEKLPPSFADRGDPIPIGACPLLIRTFWHHSIGGEPVQWRQLAENAHDVQVVLEFVWSDLRVRMKNTGEAKRVGKMQSCTIFC